MDPRSPDNRVKNLTEAVSVLLLEDLNVGNDLVSPMRSGINPGKLFKYLEWLERWGFTTITFDDYRFFLEGELSLPRRPIIITFDGGHSEVFDVAFPIMREYGMTAVVFVCGDQNLRTVIVRAGNGYVERKLVGSHEIMELHSYGFEIGSLGMTGNDLADLPLEQAEYEITRSRMKLEILLNAPVRTFAYPHGRATPALKKIIADAGYMHAVSRDSGPAVFGRDPLEIRRPRITGETSALRIAFHVFGPLVGLHIPS